jgi:hypothetical protein
MCLLGKGPGPRTGPLLFWSNVALHGTFELDLNKRLDYDRGSDQATRHGHDEAKELRPADEQPSGKARRLGSPAMAIGSGTQLERILQDAVREEAIGAAAAASLWSLRQPALRIVAGEEVEPEAPVSRLGGRPLAAPGTAWPLDDNGPLDLLMQLDLAAVARVQPELPLPDHGLLSFFYNTDDPPWQSVEPDPASWRVRWETGDLTPILGPDQTDWELFPARAVHLEPSVTLPDGNDDYVDVIVDPDRTEEFASTMRARHLLEDQTTGRRPVDHQLLGWPHLVQGSMIWSCEQESQVYRHHRAQDAPEAKNLSTEDWDRLEAAVRASDWRLLLQLGTDYEMGWDWCGGGGLYFLLPGADLIAGRFERTWTAMQTT